MHIAVASEQFLYNTRVFLEEARAVHPCEAADKLARYALKAEKVIQ